MADLITEPNLADVDGFYERLIAAHAGLDDDASRQLNAKLILLLANHIGDNAILDTALKLARRARDGSD
ncbi:MAG: DUF2783 domain-containing protein [Alphaproteobacteria bacterium]|nr:DUF2783 domain-containing protein [Alphaproteobacteria bacterium]